MDSANHVGGNFSQSAATATSDAVQMMQSMNPVSVAQHQMTSAVSAPSAGGGATIDMASVLAKIQQLEREKADMKNSLDITNHRLSKFQESKRGEMEAMMNTTISKWIEQLQTKDAASKESLVTGLQELVKNGNESGAWNVVACASSNWVENVNKIEELTNRINSYEEKERQLQGGIFQQESSRMQDTAYSGSGTKRKASDACGTGAPVFADHDIWGEFHHMISSQGGNVGMDPSLLSRPTTAAAVSGGGGAHSSGGMGAFNIAAMSNRN